MSVIVHKQVAESLIKLIEHDLNLANTPSKKITGNTIYKIGASAITIYANNTIMFQGASCQSFEQKWFGVSTGSVQTLDQENSTLDYFSAEIIGNDEVGVGDIFGPLVVTSTYLEKNTINQIKRLNIKDSKSLNDTEINSLAPTLIQLMPHFTIILSNRRYNEWYDRYRNSHVLKALVHNQCLVELLKNPKADNYREIIIDEFASKQNYYKYLQNETTIVKERVAFMTKGESKHCAVAASSIISRYYFLEAIKRLESKFKIELPLGANNHVKIKAQQYMKKFSQEEYSQFIKLHFNIQIK